MTFVLHTNGPVRVGSAVLGGITGINSALGSQVRGEPTSGEVFARVVAIMSQKPALDFTCEDIRAALSACGPMGVSLATANLTLFASKILSGGRIDSSGHASLTAALGVLVPQTLSCSHQANATISYQAHPIVADDDSDPWTLSTGATLPSIAAANLWTLESASIAGVTVAQHTQISVEFGLRVITEGSSSNIRDQLAAIRSVLPKISLTSSKQGGILDFLGASGSFAIVLRQRKQGGAFDSGTVTLSGTCLGLQETPLSVSGQNAGQVRLQGHVLYDGTHDPITYAGA